MKLSDVMGAMQLALYAEVALVIFFLVFLLIVAQLLLRRRSAHWEHVRRLPLDDAECDCDCDGPSQGANDG